MAKSKEQKRQEALARLTANIAERLGNGKAATFDQKMEYNALKKAIGDPGRITLSESRRQKSQAELFTEKLFGPGDPVTGICWADPLPRDFEPTPELDDIVRTLKSKTHSPSVIFVEAMVSLDTPEGCTYPTYLGSGNYLDQWVQRETDFQLHHCDPYTGAQWRAVFCRKGQLPQYDENDNRIGGITKEEYARKRHLYHKHEPSYVETE